MGIFLIQGHKGRGMLDPLFRDSISWTKCQGHIARQYRFRYLPSLKCCCRFIAAIDILILAVFFYAVIGIALAVLPLTASITLGVLHFYIAYSSLIVVVCMHSKLLSIDGASAYLPDTQSTEQVPTTGLYWVRDHLQTDSTL